jgi:hypothetical protein
MRSPQVSDLRIHCSRGSLSFGYDAQQNRLKKEGKFKTNYYIREAQGNVLAARLP